MKKKERRKFTLKDFFVILALTIVVILSLAGIFYKPARNAMLAEKSNTHQVAKFTKNEIKQNEAEVAEAAKAVETGNATPEQKEVAPSYNFAGVESITPEAFAKYSSAKLVTTGGIAIPSLGINLPIFTGVSNANLTYGAGTMLQGQKMGEGNYALASHHVFTAWGGESKLLFTPLIHASNGMDIYTTDKEYVYSYHVVSVKSVEPTATYVLDQPTNDQAYITLVTCTDANASGRVIVTGILDKKEKWDSASSQVQNSFLTKYNQFGG